MSDSGEIAELRKEIDALDDEILRLLNRRARLVIRIGEVKSKAKDAFHQPAREKQIIDRLTAENSGPFPSDAIRPVFREILSACLSLEAPLKVSFLGPEASFTHMAARERFGLSAIYNQQSTIPAVFDEVSRGRADYGVIPIEDSAEGVVQHTLDSFLDSDLKIVAEVVLEVAHHLLSRAQALGDIDKVYTTAASVASCKKWLAQHLPRATIIEVPSTAAAAESASADKSAAAIGPELLTQLSDLKILMPKIDDQAHNFTRLLVIGRNEAPVTARDKTSLLFTLKDEPGSLYRVLKSFSDHKVNLTKIESRPSRRRAWDYTFFVDFEGHARSPEVAKALAELQAACAFVKVLGSYPKAESVEQ